MGTTLRGVLSVDEGVVLLAILVGVGKSNLDILPFEMDDVVQPLTGHVVFEEVFQTVTRKDSLTIVDKSETRIKIGIVT